MIRDEKGFSIHQVDAEAGLHPEAPSSTDQKVLTDDGHAYWLRSEPVLAGGILEVGLAVDRYGQKVWLRVNDKDAERFHAFTSAHVGDQFAFVLNGRMIGEPIQIMMPISGERWELPPTFPLIAYTRCVGFEMVKEGAARNSNPSMSSCQPGL